MTFPIHLPGLTVAGRPKEDLFPIQFHIQTGLRDNRHRAMGWMLRLSRSLSRFETQDIMTQPQFNH